MKNEYEIRANGVHVHVTSCSQVNKLTKILLLSLMPFTAALIAWLFIFLNPLDETIILFPLALISLTLIFFTARLVAWKIYGKEHIIVNTKSVSYYYEYGFLQTKIYTTDYHKLALGFESICYKNSVEMGKLLLVNYNEKNHLPEPIFESSILLPKEKLVEIDLCIRQLFAIEFFEAHRFIPFSLN